MRNPGVIVMLSDGRQAIAYNKEQKQAPKGKMLLRTEDGKRVIKEPSQFKIIGYVD